MRVTLACATLILIRMFVGTTYGAPGLVHWNPPGNGGNSVDGLYHIGNINDGLSLYNTDYFSNTYPHNAPVVPFTPGFPLGDAVGIGANSVVNYGPIDISFPGTKVIDIHVLSLDGMALKFDTTLPQHAGITPSVLSSVHMSAEAFTPVNGVFTYGDDALPGDQSANNEFQAAAGTIRFTSASSFSAIRFGVIPGYNMPDNGDGAEIAITDLATVPEPAGLSLLSVVCAALLYRARNQAQLSQLPPA